MVCQSLLRDPSIDELLPIEVELQFCARLPNEVEATEVLEFVEQIEIPDEDEEAAEEPEVVMPVELSSIKPLIRLFWFGGRKLQLPAVTPTFRF